MQAAPELFRNTVHVQILESGNVINSGVGLYLGTYKQQAFLLLPEHVLVRSHKLRQANTGLQLRSYNLNGDALTFGFEDIYPWLIDAQFERAVSNDYMIVAINISPTYEGLIFDLTRDHFVRPQTGARLYVYGQTSISSYTDNYGIVADLRKGEVSTFTLKTEDIIQTGESGSVIMSEDHVHGILTDADGRAGYVVYPSSDLSEVMELIESKTEKQATAVSLAWAPTYQLISVIEETEPGVSQNSRDSEIYQQVDMELYRLVSNRAKGETSSFKYGLLFGYSPEEGHALGYADNAEYTVKWGVLVGSVDRYTNNTGQLSLFVLSHKIGDDFKHRLGVAFEATWGVDFTTKHSFDIGFRIEINKLVISDLDSAESVFGAGLVMRYSWITPF